MWAPSRSRCSVHPAPTVTRSAPTIFFAPSGVNWSVPDPALSQVNWLFFTDQPSACAFGFNALLFVVTRTFFGSHSDTYSDSGSAGAFVPGSGDDRSSTSMYPM